SRFNILAGLVMASLLAVAARAQEGAGGVVAGRVIDEGSGYGVSWANVRVVETGQTATTDLSGSYALNNVPAGTVTIFVEKDGYQPANITDVAIAAGAAAQLDIPLGATGGDVIKMEAFSV